MPEALSGTTPIHYERSGPSEGASATDPRSAVLLVPMGLASARATWGRLPEVIGRHVTTLTPDLRGFGRSGPVRRHSFASIPGDLVAVLEDAKFPAAHVVAAGDGAVAALHLALERPERVLSLVLASGRAYVDDRDLAFVAAKRGTPEADWWDTYRFDRAYLDVRHALHRVTRPVLLVHGESDPWATPHHADILSAGFPHARTFVVGGAGHRVQETSEFATLLAAFLRDRGVLPEGAELPAVGEVAAEEPAPRHAYANGVEFVL